MSGVVPSMPFPYCTVLCCAVLCCAVLCCAVLCCAVLCCAVLCCAVLCCAVLCCAVLCCAVLCCAVLCCPVLCCAVLRMFHSQRFLLVDMLVNSVLNQFRCCVILLARGVPVVCPWCARGVPVVCPWCEPYWVVLLWFCTVHVRSISSIVYWLYKCCSGGRKLSRFSKIPHAQSDAHQLVTLSILFTSYLFLPFFFVVFLPNLILSS